MKKMTYAKFLSITVFVSVALIIILSSGKAAAATFCGCGLLSPVNASNSDANCEHENNASCVGSYPAHTVANTYGSNNLESAGASQATLKSNFINNLNWFAGQHPYQQISAAWMEAQLGGGNWAARINSPAVTLKLENHAYNENTMYMPADNGGNPSTTNGSVEVYGESASALSVVIYVNGVEYDAVKVDCGNMVGSMKALPPPDQLPTGTIAITCAPTATAGNYTIKVTFKDPDGATSGEIRDKPGQVWGPDNGTSATWTIPTTTLIPGDFPVTLWVKDVGVSAPTPNAYKQVASANLANCVPQGSVTATPASCHQINVKAWDPNAPSTTIHFYVTVNGGGNYTPNPSTVAGVGATTTSDVINDTQFDPWKASNSVTVYATDLETGAATNIGTVTLAGPCDSLTCGTSSLPGDLVPGQKNLKFTVSMKIAGAEKTAGYTIPTGGKFSPVNLVDLGTTSYAATAPSGNTMVSVPIAYQPETPEAGTSLTWNFTGGESNPASQVPACHQDNIRIAYEPYFTVLGGDVAAGQGFGDTCKAQDSDIMGENLDTSGSYFGASTRQAAIATGQISLFASDVTNNMPTNLGGGSDGLSAPQPSRLAFANADPSGIAYPQGTTYGAQFLGTTPTSQTWCVPDYEAAAGPTSGPFVPGSGTSGTFQLTSSTLPAMTINPGQHVTVVATGDVYINGDITYGSYNNNLDQIPEFTLVVKGGNIYINKNVDELHGFYDTQLDPSTGKGGTLYTCTDPATNAPSTSYSVCGPLPTVPTGAPALTIYGSVAATKIVPGRMLGNIATATSSTDDPAEQFVFSPELWLGSTTAPVTKCEVDPTQPQCLYESYTSLPPVF